MKNAQNIQAMIESFGESMKNVGRHTERESHFCINLHQREAIQKLAAIKAALADEEQKSKPKPSLLDGKDKTLAPCVHAASRRATKNSDLVYVKIGRDTDLDEAGGEMTASLCSRSDVALLINWLREVHLEAFGCEVQS